MLTSAETSTYRVSVGNLRLPLNISTVTRKKKLITFHKLPSFLRFCSLFYSFENTEKSKCTKKKQKPTNKVVTSIPDYRRKIPRSDRLCNFCFSLWRAELKTCRYHILYSSSCSFSLVNVILNGGACEIPIREGGKARGEAKEQEKRSGSLEAALYSSSPTRREGRNQEVCF